MASGSPDRPRQHLEPVPDPGDSEEWLTPAQVAALFGVHPKTVTRWAKARRLEFIRTLGGHRRYRRADVERLVGRAEDDAPES